MNMQKIGCALIVFFALAYLASQRVSAQGLDDAIYMSQNDYVTSARVLGTGNAMGAIGGDIGALNLNPATIGSFRRSYVPVIGIGINGNNTSIPSDQNSTWSKNKNSGSADFFFSNIGFIVNSNNPTNNWSTVNFGISFNRVANFNESLSFSGRDVGSIGQRWVSLANGTVPENLESQDPFEAFPAYQTFAIDLIDPDNPDATEYFSDYGANDVLNKSFTNEISGGANNLMLSIGGNLQEKLMLGLNVGIPFYNLDQDLTYSESDNDQSNFYEGIEFSEFTSTSGIGFNVAAGAIIMPTPKLRFGMNFASPTWYNVSRNFITETDFRTDEGENSYTSPDGFFDYKFRTPWKIGAQAGYIIGKYGFVDIEAEYTDYSNSQFNYESSFSGNENAINRVANESFGSALSLRGGGELALQSFRLRLGLGLNQNAYENDSKFYPQYHFGTGVRGDSYFFDIGYRFKQAQYAYSPYTINDPDFIANENSVPVQSNSHVFIATLGISL